MEPASWDAPLDGAEELAAVLDYSGVAYERQDNRFRFRFSSRGCRWQMVCDGMEGRVMAYAIHPTPVRDRAAALCCTVQAFRFRERRQLPGRFACWNRQDSDRRA